MSYRYNTIDIIVGVGMCAILFGGLLLFLAANGTYQAVLPQALALEQSSEIGTGMSALQPAIGHAIVEKILLERRNNRAVAQSVSEWNRTSLAYLEFASGSGSMLKSVMRHAQAVPIGHMARVEGIKGRAIVNFTTRGIRHDLLSADQYGTIYNMKMISAIEAQGQRLHDQFASTWQATLGHRIVEAAQHDWFQAGAIQERLGSALVQVVRAQMSSEEGLAAQQEQLASLIFAAVRNEVITDRPTQPIVAAPSVVAMSSENITVASTESASWPEIPMAYLIAAGLLLTAVFWGGLSMAAQGREAKALAQMRREADRWAFRMAA
ncbi:MAG TPA: hypothetical protein VN666_18465 [Nitrospira sp.]|nr:hypothetical protein [Nitrospira sp.]